MKPSYGASGPRAATFRSRQQSAKPHPDDSKANSIKSKLQLFGIFKPPLFHHFQAAAHTDFPALDAKTTPGAPPEHLDLNNKIRAEPGTKLVGITSLVRQDSCSSDPVVDIVVGVSMNPEGYSAALDEQVKIRGKGGSERAFVVIRGFRMRTWRVVCHNDRLFSI